MTFIAIEGIEGSGKSTLLLVLADRLRADGYGIAVTREPGGTPLGEALRDIFLNRSLAISPLSEAFLVNAARAQHVRDVVRPALARGAIVLCDRFIDSTLAYQGFGRGLDLESLKALCAIAADGLEPDLVLVLDLSVEAARSRLRERAGSVDRMEAEGDDFHERVRRGFLTLAADSSRHRVLDATLPARRLLEAALREVRAQLGAPVP